MIDFVKHWWGLYEWKHIAPIIAALIASGTALYISNRWSRQKGAEVIAEEAKEAIYLINELEGFVSVLNHISNKNQLETILPDIRDTSRKLQDKLKFLVLGKFDNTGKDLTYFMLSTSINFVFKQGEESEIQYVDRIKSKIIDIAAGKYKALDVLRDYAMYRKKI